MEVVAATVLVHCTVRACGLWRTGTRRLKLKLMLPTASARGSVVGERGSIARLSLLCPELRSTTRDVFIYIIPG